MPMCCRAENGVPESKADRAGEYGEFKCDLPRKTLTKMFQFINNTIKPDVIFWTGDMAAHYVWNDSVKDVAEANKVIADELQATLPNVMVYPILGNHDVWPVNVQSFEEPSYMVQNLTDVWGAYWLDKNAKKTF